MPGFFGGQAYSRRRQWYETMRANNPDSVATSEHGPMNPTVQLGVSLFVIVHLFFVFAALASNVAPRSELQRRLLVKFAFYTQLLNLDLDFTPYHLTHATEQDVDHRLEVLMEGDPDVDENWLVLPDAGVRIGERLQTLPAFGASDGHAGRGRQCRQLDRFECWGSLLTRTPRASPTGALSPAYAPELDSSSWRQCRGP